MMARVALLIPFAALLVACDSSSLPPTPTAWTPVGPSAVTAATTNDSTAARPTQATREVVVNIMDACDPDSFNNAGFGHICDRAGGVKFDQFIAILTKFGFIQPWQFAPSIANVAVGETFTAINRGGETHTFTHVANFGGGLIEPLNQLSHNPTPAPECTTLDPDDFVVPGGTYRETVEHSGRLKFQCCIHPWMRLEATSR